MDYSRLNAMAQREDARHRAAHPAELLHRTVLAGARPGLLLRASRRLRGRGPRPAHVLDGEVAPRSRAGQRPDTSCA